MEDLRITVLIAKSNMIYFLYGAETYRLKQKAREIENQFCKKSGGGLNLEKIDFSGGKIAFQDFWEALFQRSMFVSNKLFFLENVLSNGQFSADFLKNIKKIAAASDVVVILEKGKPDKKSALFKALLKQAQCQEFLLLKDDELKAWLKEEAARYGASFEGSALNALLLASNDLWRLHNELKKLASYSKIIRQEHIQLLVKLKVEPAIFNTIDALAERDKPRAWRLLQRHLAKGDSPFYIFSMFIYQFRNLLSVKASEGRPATLTGLKLHPFVLQKTGQQARYFSLTELKKIYQRLFNLDWSVKVGRLSIEDSLKTFITET